MKYKDVKLEDYIYKQNKKNVFPCEELIMARRKN